MLLLVLVLSLLLLSPLFASSGRSVVIVNVVFVNVVVVVGVVVNVTVLYVANSASVGIRIVSTFGHVRDIATCFGDVVDGGRDSGVFGVLKACSANARGFNIFSSLFSYFIKLKNFECSCA